VLAGPWLAELSRLAGLLSTGLLAGFFLGAPLLGLLAGALAHSVFSMVNLVRLERWVRSTKKTLPPPAPPVWRDLYHHFHRVQQRSRKRKRKLTNYLKRFKASAAALPDAAVILGPEDGIEWFNEAAGRLLGLRMPGDLGQRVGNLVRHPAFHQFLTESREGDTVEFPSPEDERLTLSASVIRYGGDQRLLLARDVSRLARLEQARRDFVANVSHELRTPLTVITGYLETLLDSADEGPASWQRSLRSMADQAARMGRLVDDLLLLARLEAADAAAVADDPVAVPALLAAVEEEARLRSAGKHRIETEVDPQVWLRGEAEALRSVFNNLVQNALQYTPEGGGIRLRWRADETGAHFSVSDTGIGIEPQHIARLTERFYRVDTGRSRARGGTGLGLAIVKHVLGRHGGELRIESALGEGSTFTCDFPATRVVARPAAQGEGRRLAAVSGPG
jgi:two-component system phosphate regulon sensor histidine kinase PhoR